MTKNKDELNATSSENIKLNTSSADDDLFVTSNDEQAIVLENKKTKMAKEEKPKRNGSKKQTFLKQLRTIGVLMLLGIFSGCGLGIWYFNSELKVNIDYDIDPTPYLYDISSIMKNSLGIEDESNFSNFVDTAKAKSIKPSDLTPAQNFALAEYKAQQANTWTAIGYGEISTIVQQSIYSEKKFDGEKATFVNISMSSIVKVAKCYEYFNDATSVNVYNGSNPQKDSATWSKASPKTTSEFKDKMGNLPNAIQPYIISDKTIIEGNTVDNVIYDSSNGNYSFTIELDTVTSVLRYVRQVRETGGLGAYPIFHSIIQTITIDEDWNLVSIKIKDNYDAIVGFKVQCSGYLDTYYSFNKSDIQMPDLPE